MYSNPGVTLGNYVSYFCSPYHHWFSEMGYPLLDINRYEDGEWEIIQFLRSPVVPHLTPWSRVLTKMRHIDISPWIVKKYVENLDLEKRHVWDELEKSEAKARQRQLAEELHVEDTTRRQFEAIRNNPALMERIARNGMQEVGLRRLARHIPNHHYRKGPKKGVTPSTT